MDHSTGPLTRPTHPQVVQRSRKPFQCFRKPLNGSGSLSNASASHSTALKTVPTPPQVIQWLGKAFRWFRKRVQWLSKSFNDSENHSDGSASQPMALVMRPMILRLHLLHAHYYFSRVAAFKSSGALCPTYYAASDGINQYTGTGLGTGSDLD